LAKRIRSELWYQSRKTADSTPPPEGFVVTPEGESRMISEFYQEAYMPKPVPLVAATEKPAPPPKRRWFIFRIFGPSSTPPPAPTPRPAGVPVAAPEKPAPLSEAEMRVKVLEAIKIDENALHQLGAERAAKVKQYLTDQGQVPAERITMAPNAVSKGTQVNLQLK
jgi:hypothetical protein